MNWNELYELLPVGVVLGTALVVVFLDLALPKKERYVLSMVAMGGCLLALGALAETYLSIAAYYKSTPPWFAAAGSAPSGGFNPFILGGAFVIDGFGLAVSVVALLAGALSILSSAHEDLDSNLTSGEFYGLILLGVSGMMLLGLSHEFLTLLVSLEIMSISTYILAGARRDTPGAEAALKYLVLGAFSTAFLMMGIAFFYGATGGFSLAPASLKVLEQIPSSGYLLRGALGLLLVGALFKVGAAPFHFWIPDVYQGAPSGVTGLMATGVKAAAFAVLGRLAFETFGLTYSYDWCWVFAAAAVLTMAVGNFLALKQDNVKRMLAYSGIAHTGYLLLAFLVSRNTTEAEAAEQLQNAAFYLLAYGVITLGAFGVVGLVREDGRRLETFDDFAGLAKEHPALALCMACFMFSLAGLPPFAGFFAKFLVFRSAIDAGYVLPAVLGILTSVASLYYYLRVVRAMYLDPVRPAALGQEPVPARCRYAWTSNLVIYGAGLVTLVLGMLPQWLTGLVW
ncbi:MAG: NADH-quinone oxidoreductase subunit N [Planctomycetota bacterium]|nr:NADH-quinone oxidoreductase subunit N [Planctomycetota bacterium]